MIIFDLDGTLANCEHRRHFVNKEAFNRLRGTPQCPMPKNGCWEPDWDAFFEACDEDIPVESVCSVFGMYSVTISCWPEEIEIWSGRSESVREKTVNWLRNHLLISEDYCETNLRMRPIGDYTPDDVLKERWLDEAIAQGKKIHYVFDDRPKVVEMWRRRGIFVFDCNQSGKEF